MIVVTILSPGYARCDEKNKYHADGTVTLIRAFCPSPTPASKPVFTILVDTGSPFSRSALASALSSINVSVNSVDVVIGTHGHVDHIGNLNLFANNDSETVFYLGTDVLKPKDVYDSIHFLPVEVDAWMLDDGAETKITFDNASFITFDGLEYLEDSFLLLSTPGHTASDLSLAAVSDEVLITCLECEKKRSQSQALVELCSSCGSLNFEPANPSHQLGRKKVVVVAGDLFESENDDDDDGAAWRENSMDVNLQEKSRREVLAKADFIVPGHGKPWSNKEKTE